MLRRLQDGLTLHREADHNYDDDDDDDYNYVTREGFLRVDIATLLIKYGIAQILVNTECRL